MSTKLRTKHSWVMRIQIYSNEDHYHFPLGGGDSSLSNEELFNSHKVDNGLFASFNKRYDIIMSVFDLNSFLR